MAVFRCFSIILLFSCFNTLSCVMYFAITDNTISTVTMGGEVSVLILTGGEVVMWLVGGACATHTLRPLCLWSVKGQHCSLL